MEPRSFLPPETTPSMVKKKYDVVKVCLLSYGDVTKCRGGHQGGNLKNPE